ncbi:hypothetical protein EKO27_g8806 [Xylaria grammica]|uniref:Uncharacterized protein n=1 Tax=Xylaria grammica TaxID=363999 RepID=A0A439CVS4_9PEZI|nr:hypothetical protein EKO27_g8806 [Xylaria grammica]
MVTQQSPIGQTAEETGILTPIHAQRVYSTIERQVAFAAKPLERQIENVYMILIRLTSLEATEKTRHTASKHISKILEGQRIFQCLSLSIQEAYVKNVYEYASMRERETPQYPATARAEDMTLTAAYLTVFFTSIVNNSYQISGNKENWFLWRVRTGKAKNKGSRDTESAKTKPDVPASPPLTPFGTPSLQIRSSLPFDPIRQANFEAARDNRAHTNSEGNTTDNQGHAPKGARLPSIHDLLKH